MSNIILDFAVPVKIYSVSPSVNTSYIKKALVIIKDTIDADKITLLTSPVTVAPAAGAVDLRVLNAAMDGGLSSISYITRKTLDLTNIVGLINNTFFTIIAVGFTDAEFTARKDAGYNGVWIKQSLSLVSKLEPKVGYIYDKTGYTSIYTMANFLSQNTLSPLNYQTTNKNVDLYTDSLGLANTAYDSRFSFWMQDDTKGKILASFFIFGKDANFYYIEEEVKLKIQDSIFKLLQQNFTWDVVGAATLEGILNAYLETFYISRNLITKNSKTTVLVSVNEQEFDCVFNLELTRSLKKVKISLKELN